jgi:antitoxin YefM
MPIETTYTQARDNLASYFDKAANDREVIIVRRRNRRGQRLGDVAIISAEELESIMETAHLLSSPRNARRLLTALNRALASEGTPTSIEQLRREVGIDPVNVAETE